MKLEIGDRVVHPQYGVGHVVKLEEREFEPGLMRRYYEISIHGSTLCGPSDQPTFGLRKLAVRREIDRCRQILSSRPLHNRPLLAEYILRNSQEGSDRPTDRLVRTICRQVTHNLTVGDDRSRF